MGHTQVLCQGIEVDELLAPIFNIIWNQGIKTFYSCQGFNTENDGYISFVSVQDTISFLDLIGDNYDMIRVVYDNKGTKVHITKDELIAKKDEPHLCCIINFSSDRIESMIKILISSQIVS